MTLSAITANTKANILAVIEFYVLESHFISVSPYPTIRMVTTVLNPVFINPYLLL